MVVGALPDLRAGGAADGRGRRAQLEWKAMSVAAPQEGCFT
jgi:hypothetical protein